VDTCAVNWHSQRVSSNLQQQRQSRAWTAGLALMFLGLGAVSIALVGLGFVGAGWSGVNSEVVPLWAIGGLLVAVSVAGCRLSRAGARPWMLLAAWVFLFALLATLLALLD